MRARRCRLRTCVAAVPLLLSPIVVRREFVAGHVTTFMLTVNRAAGPNSCSRTHVAFPQLSTAQRNQQPCRYPLLPCVVRNWSFHSAF